MRRRKFITLVGSAAVASPFVARAQQPAMPVLGYLSPGSAGPSAHQIDGLRKGLAEAGFVEHRNIAIEYRWAENQLSRLPELAADLVRRRVAVIAALGTSAPGLAAKAATSAIPIVFQTGADPVADGLVTSMNRPGGNVTGISRMNVALDPKGLRSCTKPFQQLPSSLVCSVRSFRVPNWKFSSYRVPRTRSGSSLRY